MKDFLRRKLNFLRKIKFFNSELPNFKKYKYFFEGKCGLEIGGPSSIFFNKNYLPVYKYAKKIDGCNFSNKTIVT